MDKRVDSAADDAADGRWMTYAELGATRGITKESALKLALRRKWRKQDDNQGHVRVYVPLEWAPPRDTGADAGADQRADMSRAITALDAAVATLREQLARADAAAATVVERDAYAVEHAAGD